jgi:hypothetical protein
MMRCAACIFFSLLLGLVSEGVGHVCGDSVGGRGTVDGWFARGRHGV